MGSSGKKRTTMAKLNRESKLRDKRIDKEARKNARKLTGAGNGLEPEFGVEEGVVPTAGDDEAGLAAPSEDVSETPAEIEPSIRP